MRALKTLCGAAALLALLAPGAHADEWNKRTYLPFSGPVKVPGATLPAGTYPFKIANPDTTRHVIRVSEKDSGKHIGLFMTIPNDRLDPPDENLVMFAERPAGVPQAIQAWFYPGDRIGEEFVYPKSQAVAIAKANRKPVLATETADNASATEESRMSAMKGASVGRVDENGTMSKDDKKADTTTANNDQSRPQTSTGQGSSRAATTTAPRSTTAQQTSTAPKATTAPRANTADNARANTAKTNTANAQNDSTVG